MENAEEILQCLDEFAKLRPKEIPPELEYYLSFVARTGDPVYQWPLIKCLFREKLINVITEFYEACPSVEIPPCPNVEIFNYEAMKGFILEKLDTFAAAPFTVQRICELLTSPRKEYNRIDKYMRALEKNILVVSTREPGNRKSTENGESVVNGLEEHNEQEQEMNSMNSDINVEVDMDEKTVWHKSYETDTEASNIILETTSISTSTSTLSTVAASASASTLQIQEAYVSDSKTESVITTRQINYIGYTNEIITTTTETETEAEAEAEIETEAEAEHEDTTEQPQQHLEVVENSEFSSSLTTTTTTSKDTNPEELQSKVEEEEHIYVTETVVNKEADCSQQMETTPIICAETEPITPPEPEASENSSDNSSENTPDISSGSILEAAMSKQQPQQEEAIVESSSEVEAAISSSEEVTKASETKDTQEEVSASDEHQEVVSESSSSSCIIGPEDMQVEDISPEPETKDTTQTKQDQPESKEESVIVEPEVTELTDKHEEEQPLKIEDKIEEVKLATESVTETAAAVTENVTETDKQTENN